MSIEQAITNRYLQEKPMGNTTTEQSEPMLQFFEFDHLDEELQTVSRNFHNLAYVLVALLPRNPERTTALRKLLEAKDCAVRATIYK